LAEKLMMKLPTIAMATGSACTSALQSPSHVLTAMGVSQKDAYSAIRISLGRFTTNEEIDITIEGLLNVLKTL
jgi:cysteine desulfurase